MSNHIVAAVALGTRGDVQPVAAVAWQLAQQLCSNSSSSCLLDPETNIKAENQQVSVTFITHAAHKAWLEQWQFECCDRAAGQQLQLLFISSLPAAVWHASKGTADQHQDKLPNRTSQVRLGALLNKSAAALVCCWQQQHRSLPTSDYRKATVP
jgi:hypothetical protein